MKKYVKMLKMAIYTIAALTFAGCVNVEYVGQTFPALPEETPVTIYSPEAPMPDHGYRAIGRITLTAPDGNSLGSVRDELSECAREHGAEAVSVVEFKRVEVGFWAVESASVSMPDWSRDNRNAGGAFIYSNSFGERVAVNSQPRQKIYELRVKALLLVTDARFNEMMEIYRKQREKLDEKLDKTRLKVQASTAEEALDKSVKPVENSPVPPEKKAPAAEKKVIQLDLTDDRSAPAAL